MIVALSIWYAIDSAIKVARWATKRPRNIAFIGAFHGKSIGARSLRPALERLTADNYHPLLWRDASNADASHFFAAIEPQL